MTPLPEDEVPFSTSVTQSDIDPGAFRVAMVYANALFAAAEKKNVLEQVMAELDELIAVLERVPKFTEVLASGMIPSEEKISLIDRTLNGKVEPLFLDFLKVLAEHERGGELRSIQRAMRDLHDERFGSVRVRVTTAKPLDKESTTRIAAQLRGVLHAEPILEPHVDPRVIGGVVFRIGDTVYDGSVSAQLEAVRRQMITRSVHEIQSRRDRFSNSAGN
jgi:F-type H+-transporting ATPase subunit delta